LFFKGADDAVQMGAWKHEKQGHKHPSHSHIA
jgi:hypothetical protein